MRIAFITVFYKAEQSTLYSEQACLQKWLQIGKTNVTEASHVVTHRTTGSAWTRLTS